MIDFVSKLIDSKLKKVGLGLVIPAIVGIKKFLTRDVMIG
jgi:hypothetical protein